MFSIAWRSIRYIFRYGVDYPMIFKSRSILMFTPMFLVQIKGWGSLEAMPPSGVHAVSFWDNTSSELANAQILYCTLILVLGNFSKVEKFDK